MTTYTTHPFLLIYPRKIEKERCFAIDLRSKEPAFIVEDPIIVWALTALPAEFTKADAVAVWSREDKTAPIVEDIWEFACGEGLILSLEEAAPLIERQAVWEKIAWSDAAVYHEGTRDYPFVEMNRKGAFLADNARMKDYEEGWPAPDVYQSFKFIRSVQLEKVNEDFVKYLGDRSSVDFSLKDLSLIFDFCFGERLRLEHAYDEQNFLQLESLRKVIPSGGGRHPTEVFLVSLDPALGLEQGLYHYNVKSNSLDCLREGDLYEELKDKLGLAIAERPLALLFFSSLCERAMWRYRDPRSWRAFVIDVGHCEFMCAELCRELGLSFEALHGFQPDKSAGFLGIDAMRQPVMSIATLTRLDEVKAR